MNDWQPGATVSLPIPRVDRANVGARNMPGIIEHIEGNNAILVTEVGLLANPIPKWQLSRWTGPIPSVPADPQKIALTSAFRKTSGFKAGTSFSTCRCNTKCTNLRCACRKAKLQCSSRCHPSNSHCNNK